MALREIAAKYNFSVPVSNLGKIKTIVQQAYLTLVILNPYQDLREKAFFINNYLYIEGFNLNDCF